MRVLYLASDPTPSPKGAGVRIAQTVRALGELGHEVRLFTPSAADGASLEGEVAQHQTVDLPQPNFLQRAMALRQAAGEWLEEQQADWVQFRGLWEGIPAVAWARTHGARAVFEAHGFPSIELPYHHPAVQGDDTLLEKLVLEERAVLQGADLILTPSRTGFRHLLMRGVPAARIAVVPNAVDPDRFSPGPAPPDDEPPYRVIYVGTLAPWQGLTFLLEALTRFRGREQVELHVVGPAKSRWRRQIRSYARSVRVHQMVQLSGATTQENLVPVLRSAHLCVAPMPADPRNAVQGCCPIKVLEYMAAGRPILATRIPPLLEILEHQRSGFLVAPGSPAALAEGLAWMLAHPEEREALGLRAREDLMARFPAAQFPGWLDQALERVTQPS
jgi:glycosyltransferase involved in cell wall biosynthesis